MLSIENIKTDFSYIKALSGGHASYHNSVIFEGYGDMCDLYFESKNEKINQGQVDSYNQLASSYKRHLKEIERYILDGLTQSETKRIDKIQNALLRMDVIDIPYDNPKYDLVLICGKSYSSFLFLRKEIAVRVEFSNGAIQSMQRKRNVMKEND